MVTARLLACTALVAAAAACGSSNGAPRGVVTECGTIAHRGGFMPGGAANARNSAECFVRAVHACHAARLQLHFMGVDSGTTQVLTVRRASRHTCATAVAITSFVLTRTTKRHEVCATAVAAADGVDLSDCRHS